jgi:hypothetical protein
MNMATEGHKCVQGSNRKMKRKAKIDKEFTEIQAQMKTLAFKMQ